MRVVLPEKRYPTADARLRFFEALERRASLLPGVEAVGYANNLPLRGGWGSGFGIDGVPPRRRATFQPTFRRSAPAIFRRSASRSPRAGSISGDDTTRSAPIAVVSRLFERRFLDGQSALGRQIRRGQNTPLHHHRRRRRGRAARWEDERARTAGLSPGGADRRSTRCGSPTSPCGHAATRPIWCRQFAPRYGRSIREQPVSNVRTLDELLHRRQCGPPLPGTALLDVRACWRWSSPRWGPTAWSRTSSRSARRKSASASRSDATRWRISRWLLARTLLIRSPRARSSACSQRDGSAASCRPCCSRSPRRVRQATRLQRRQHDRCRGGRQPAGRQTCRSDRSDAGTALRVMRGVPVSPSCLQPYSTRLGSTTHRSDAPESMHATAGHQDKQRATPTVVTRVGWCQRRTAASSTYRPAKSGRDDPEDQADRHQASSPDA